MGKSTAIQNANQDSSNTKDRTQVKCQNAMIKVDTPEKFPFHHFRNFIWRRNSVFCQAGGEFRQPTGESEAVGE
jgi:hypothetical protein